MKLPGALIATVLIVASMQVRAGALPDQDYQCAVYEVAAILFAPHKRHVEMDVEGSSLVIANVKNDSFAAAGHYGGEAVYVSGTKFDKEQTAHYRTTQRDPKGVLFIKEYHLSENMFARDFIVITPIPSDRYPNEHHITVSQSAYVHDGTRNPVSKLRVAMTCFPKRE